MTGDDKRPLLEVSGVTMTFGGIVALDAVDCDVYPNEILGLIGPNGAGKTTLFNVITQLYSPDTGDIEFDGHNLMRLRPSQVLGVGVSRTFQHAAAVPGLSALDQVMLAGYSLGRASWVTAPLGLFNRSDRALARHRSMDALVEVGLEDYADTQSTALPLGLLKRLDVARALVTSPRLILLDEPANGLTHDEVGELRDLLAGIREQRGLAMVLVEHHMGLVMSLCDRLVVLNLGCRLAEGEPKVVAQDPAVVAAYMGESVS